MFPNAGGQKHLVRDTKSQWDSREGQLQGIERESVMCEEDRQITEEREK